jgi:N-formylglutamate amidohydrolase
LLEIAHGATRAADFDDLAAALHGSFPEGLREFFFVNTDVGAPELARAVAGLLVTARPECAVALVRCRIPRTFLDCNRRIARDTVARASAAGEMTPGLQPWVRDARDRELLLERYFAYRELVSSAFAEVLALGGVTTFVHTYAPRSIDVAVDDEIARRLREAYAPGRIETWPLRSQVDLITADPEGVELAQRELAEGAEHEFEAAGFEVSRNTAYPLHPVTLAHELTSQRPASALCLEVRRDLLVPEFVPFVELATDPAKVARAAAPLARALAPFVAAR